MDERQDTPSTGRADEPASLAGGHNPLVGDPQPCAEPASGTPRASSSSGVSEAVEGRHAKVANARPIANIIGGTLRCVWNGMQRGWKLCAAAWTQAKAKLRGARPQEGDLVLPRRRWAVSPEGKLVAGLAVVILVISVAILVRWLLGLGAAYQAKNRQVLGPPEMSTNADGQTLAPGWASSGSPPGGWNFASPNLPPLTNSESLPGETPPPGSWGLPAFTSGKSPVTGSNPPLPGDGVAKSVNEAPAATQPAEPQDVVPAPLPPTVNTVPMMGYSALQPSEQDLPPISGVHMAATDFPQSTGPEIAAGVPQAALFAGAETANIARGEPLPPGRLGEAPAREIPWDSTAPTNIQTLRGYVAEFDTYVAQPGDSAFSIARRFFGNPARWPDIVDANPAVFPIPASLEEIPAGTVLKIPRFRSVNNR